MVSLVFFDILQLPHTVISNSEKLTHPSVHVYNVLHMGVNQNHGYIGRAELQRLQQTSGAEVPGSNPASPTMILMHCRIIVK